MIRQKNEMLWLKQAADVDGAEVKNDKALQVIERVRRKLTGRDFKPEIALDVKAQVEKLVDEATKTENLCVAFLGWCVVSRFRSEDAGSLTRLVIGVLSGDSCRSCRLPCSE